MAQGAIDVLFFFLLKNNRNVRRRGFVKKKKKYITNILGGIASLLVCFCPPVIVFVSMPSEPEPHLKFGCENGLCFGGEGRCVHTKGPTFKH